MGDGGAHINKNIGRKPYPHWVWFSKVKMGEIGVRVAILDSYTAKINNTSSDDEDQILNIFRKFCSTEIYPKYQDMDKILEIPANRSRFTLEDYVNVKMLATVCNPGLHRKLGQLAFDMGGMEKMQDMFYALSQITIYMINQLQIVDPLKVAVCLWLYKHVEYGWDGIGEWIA